MIIATNTQFNSLPLRVAEIRTHRLDLIAISAEMLLADSSRSENFGRLVEADVPQDWPGEGWDDDAYRFLLGKMTGDPRTQHGWSRYIALRNENDDRRTLCGSCGLLGPVEKDEDPEIGYGLLPQFQGRGLATEAVSGLIAWIFGHPHVRSVHAQTLPSHRASLRVMEKLGLQFAGPGPRPEEGTILFRKSRA